MAIDRDGLLRSAQKYLARGKVEAAIKEYRKILAENPTDIYILNQVGDLYARLEQFSEAVKLFTQIAEQHTRDGFFAKAIAIYRKIIKLDPTSLQVYERLAELYWRQGLINEARTQYQVLADYYQKHDNATSAITIYQRMAEMEPENPSYRLRLAELFQSMRLYEKALREYRQLADLMIVNGSIDEAGQVFSKAFEIVGDNLDFMREAITGLRDSGHHNVATRLFARAVELNPAAARLGLQAGLDPDLAPRPAAAATMPPPSVPGPLPTKAAAPSYDDAFVLEESFDEPSFEIEAPSAPGYEASSYEASSYEASSAQGYEASFQEVEEVFTLDLEAESAPMAEVAPASRANVGAWSGSDSSFEEEEFSFDLDSDEIPETMVQPPADLLAGSAFAREEEVDVGEFAFEIDLEADQEDDVEAFTIDEETAPPALAPEAPAAPRPAPPGPARPSASSLEIDWSADPLADLDLTLPPPADEGDSTNFAFSQEEEVETESDAFRLDMDEESGDETMMALPEIAEDDDFEVTIEFEESAVIPLPKVAFPSQPAVAYQAPEPEPEPEADEVEDVAIVRREEDLLAEARVFAKYGLKEKALDRINELLNAYPGHLEGLSMLVRFDFEAGRHAEAMNRANEVSRLARQQGNLARWTELKKELANAGFALEGERVARVPGAKAPEDDRIAQLLEDLSLESFAAPSTRERQERVSLQALLNDAPAAPAAPAPPPAAPPTGPPIVKTSLISLVDELGINDDDEEEVEDELPAVAQPVASAPAPVRKVDALDETGMSWLDDIVAPAEPAAGQPVAVGSTSETIFDEEDDFFDLAAELEAELDAVDIAGGTITSLAPQEQSLEEIIEGFKQGVAEHLSPEDYDTHFNLGIAYREMGLLDEAIGEFQLSSKDARYLVDSASMLGICFFDKGLPELAVRWYRKGLESPHITEEVQLGLLYDMAVAYMTLGDYDAAYRTFIEVYGMNTSFRDTSAKLQELAPLRQA